MLYFLEKTEKIAAALGAAPSTLCWPSAAGGSTPRTLKLLLPSPVRVTFPKAFCSTPSNTPLAQSPSNTPLAQISWHRNNYYLYYLIVE